MPAAETPDSDGDREVSVLDLTLREGQQRPGVSYDVDAKVAAAGELAGLGVDFIQVGFPAADDGTAAVCDRLDVDVATTGIARALRSDVEAAVAAGVDVVDLFAPTSERHLDAVLDADRDEMTESVREAAVLARDHDARVHLTAMDGFRTTPAALDELFEAVDAEVYTVADTVGRRTPAGVRERLTALTTDLSTVGVHFHDDFGLATANALCAVRAGVGKVDAAVAGVGERAGNVATEEFVAASIAGDEPVATGVAAEAVVPAAERALDALDESVSPSKPLLGAEAFTHESGLHTAAMLEEPATFEPFAPETFGGERDLRFGPDTGAGAARRLLERTGTEPTEDRVTRLLDALEEREETVDLPEATALAERLD
ncbi:MAG: LeuA family protein [Halolamina sp.]